MLHGKIKEFVEDTTLVHRALDIRTMNWESIEIKYNPSIHKFGEIKQEKTSITSHKLLLFLSISITRLNKHLDMINVTS